MLPDNTGAVLSFKGEPNALNLRYHALRGIFDNKQFINNLDVNLALNPVQDTTELPPEFETLIVFVSK